MKKANSVKEAWEIADGIISGDYVKDENRTQRAGYDIYTSTNGSHEYICDLGARLEVNKADGTSINIWIEKEPIETDTEILSIPAKQIDEKTFRIDLSNGKHIDILKDVENKFNDSYGKEQTSIWAWKIDTQFFSNDNYAKNYLETIIAEKLTGMRIINHAKYEVPCICGREDFLKEHANDSWGCHLQKENRFSNLCYGCPIAEEIQAKQDGVILIYAIK